MTKFNEWKPNIVTDHHEMGVNSTFFMPGIPSRNNPLIPQNTINGELTFPFTIRNHFTTAYSTVLAAQDLRHELLDHQRTFYKNALKTASSDPVKAYIWNAGKDDSKAQHFIDMITRNQINVYKIKTEQRINGKSFSSSNSYVVP